MTAKLPKGLCPIIATSEGEIMGIAVKGYWLVCKVRKRKAGEENDGVRAPLRDEKGRIVYAVPGGGSYVQPV